MEKQEGHGTAETWETKFTFTLIILHFLRFEQRLFFGENEEGQSLLHIKLQHFLTQVSVFP